jgi:hypothetical protein
MARDELQELNDGHFRQWPSLLLIAVGSPRRNLKNDLVILINGKEGQS